MNTTCYTLNMVYVRLGTTTTPYEIWRGKKPNLKYFSKFSCTCLIPNDREQRRKFEGIFLGYCLNNQAYNVYNQRTKAIMESVNVVVDDKGSISTPTRLDGSDAELIILNEYTKKSSQTSSVIEDGPPSNSISNYGLEDGLPSGGTT